MFDRTTIQFYSNTCISKVLHCALPEHELTAALEQVSSPFKILEYNSGKTLGLHSNRSHFPKLKTSADSEAFLNPGILLAEHPTPVFFHCYGRLLFDNSSCLKAPPMPPAQPTALPAAFHSTRLDWVKFVSSLGSRQNLEGTSISHEGWISRQ